MYPPFSGILYEKDILKNENIETRHVYQCLSHIGFAVSSDSDLQNENGKLGGKKFENAANELFLFSIITCRPAMAMIFWQYSNVSFTILRNFHEF